MRFHFERSPSKWRRRYINRFISGAGILLVIALIGACETEENPLAPYAGERPLILLRVTESFSPDVQWVGGKVAAIGVNRGERSALDSTLVWLKVAPDDEITSPISIDGSFDLSEISRLRGEPLDSLADRQVYTFWVATREALDAGLAGPAADEHTLADTTLTLSYLLNGRSSGGVSANFTIFRDERLLSDKYTVTWAPASLTFRQIAIRKGTVGGFSDLLWHVVAKEGESGLSSPLIIGETPENALTATEWAGFDTGSHVLWAATEEWEGESFGLRTRGYAVFSIFANNFD